MKQNLTPISKQGTILSLSVEEERELFLLFYFFPFFLVCVIACHAIRFGIRKTSRRETNGECDC